MPVVPLNGHRVTFFWAQTAERKFGWSESFWNSSTDTNNVATKAETLRQRLNDIHGGQSKCTDIRISVLGASRKTKILSIVAVPNPDLTDPQVSDYPTTAFQLILRSAALDRTTQWIRGIQDRDVARGGRKSLSAGTTGDFSALQTTLTSGTNSWVMRILDPARARKVITDVTPTGTCTAPGHGFLVNDRIRISQVKGLIQANGIWTVKAITPNTFDLAGWVTENPSPVFTGAGFASLQQYTFVPISSAEAGKATSHKTGRPFGLAGGRQKRRPIRRVGTVAVG